MSIAPTTTKTRRKPGERLSAITMPWTIVQDSREQSPWSFTGITGDSSEKYRSIIVPVEVGCLKSGDYAIRGMENLCCCERKSLQDVFSTLAGGRERFEAEHQHMAEMKAAFVIVEADWATILNHPPYPSRLNPLTVYRTALSWMVKYHVQWLAVPGRRFARANLLSDFEEILRDRDGAHRGRNLTPPPPYRKESKK